MPNPPSYQSTTAATTAVVAPSGGGSNTVAVPANAQAGDVMVIGLLRTGSGTVSISGFTLHSTVTVPLTSPATGNIELRVYWKRLTAADSGNYTVSLSSTGTIYPFCVHYKNVRDTGSPFDITNTGTNSSNSNTLAATSLTTTGPNRAILHLGVTGTNSVGNFIDPERKYYQASTGFTLRTPETHATDSTFGKGMLVAERLLLTAGSTGTVTGTQLLDSSGSLVSQAATSGTWLGAIVSRDKIITLVSGIATAAALGVPTVLRGVAFALPTSIGAPTAPPSLTVRGKNTITVGSIGSPVVVPPPALSAGAVILSPSSVASAASVSSPKMRMQVAPTSIVSAAALPEPAALAGDLVVPSIASGQAFGTATLLPGAAAVTVASITTAGAFGASSVRLSIAPAALASAAAFGTATLSPGMATITAQSVASAMVLPPPWLQTQVLRPTGTPTAEAFGAAKALLRIVVDDGIPADLFIQSQPALLLGAATLFPVSIGSGESVPVTVHLSLSIDPTARATTGLITSGVRYEAVVMARLPQQTGAPTLLTVDSIDWLSIKWTNVLNKSQELELTCLLGGLTDPVLQRLRTPDRLATELHILRDGATVFAGPLVTGQKRGEQLTLNARGLLAYLRYMVITDEDMWWPQSTDQHLLVRGMIDHCQDKTYGHYGIDTFDVVSSGVTREGYWKAEELHNVADRVDDLVEGGDGEGGAVGFDIDVDAATRRLQLWTPRRGIDRSTGDDAVVFDARNITDDDVAFSLAPGDIASYAIGTGTTSDENETLIAHAENAELLAAFGRAAVTDTWGKDAPDQTTLQRYVNKLLDDRDQALWLPGPNVRVDPDTDPTRYDVGDYVWFEGGGRLGVSGKFRVQQRTIEVDDAGRESGSLQFA